MEWKDFIQYMLSFSAIVGSIILFQIFNLDTNFITTFILAMFSIIISIHFFQESGKISQTTNNLLNEMDLSLKNIEKQLSGSIEETRIEPLTFDAKKIYDNYMKNFSFDLKGRKE